MAGRFLALALLLAAPAAAQDDLGPRTEPRVAHAGLFAYFGSMCDCEPRDFVFRAVAPLRGHAAPDAASPVVRTVAPGRRIEGNDWDVLVTVVTSAETRTLARDLRVEGARRMPDPRLGNWTDLPELPAFTLPAGTRITTYDAYGEEGFFHVDGATYELALPVLDGDLWSGPPTGEAAVETWFRLRPRAGAPAAWVRIDWRDTSRVQMLCETHGGCVPGFRPTFRPDRR